MISNDEILVPVYICNCQKFCLKWYGIWQSEYVLCVLLSNPQALYVSTKSGRGCSLGGIPQYIYKCSPQRTLSLLVSSSITSIAYDKEGLNIIQTFAIFCKLNDFPIVMCSKFVQPNLVWSYQYIRYLKLARI